NFLQQLLPTMLVPLFTVLGLCLALCQTAHSAGHYSSGSPVPIYVNKVGPYYNPHETYHYYELPVCRPDTIVHKSMSLGELLDGDRMAVSMFNVKFSLPATNTLLCSKTLTESDLARLRSAVEDLYYFEFVVDDIPVRGFLGHLEEAGLVPHTHRVYLWTHLDFKFYYKNDRIVYASVATSGKVDLDEITPASPALRFTYSVSWVPSAVSFEDRAQLIRDTSFFPKSLEIHWLSVINSLVLVALLIAFVSVILCRILRRDFARYNLDDEGPAGSTAAEAASLDEDNLGWKSVHADVFRPPGHKCFYSAVVGVGAQFLSIATGLLGMALLGLFNVHNHGSMNSACVLLYALTSCVAGFVSCRLFRQLGGERWVRNVLITSALFAVPLFLVWAVVNSVVWAYGTTQALPWSTVLLLLSLWLLVGFPLTIVGGSFGKRVPAGLDAPCRTRNIAREIPPLPCYKSWPVHCLISGFLSFSAVSVELYYVYATVWGRQHYSLYGILTLVYVILLFVTACVSVTTTYFQLSAEDYRWWWRSLFSGGSASLFVLAYSVYYYFWRASMSGAVQAVQFFGYSLLLCYVFFLSLGAVSFAASFRFVRYIYANIKMD
uniref:Transmembrane 9 superfamily member n=2 Tax=Macrostomum lignano TaxID=282301 RepID=A0A1I8HST5_9PLAT